jgi:hypothetical protein
MKNVNQLNLSDFSVEELGMNELMEIEGGKAFWDTVFGKVCMALLVGFAGAVGASLAEEIM